MVKDLLGFFLWVGPIIPGPRTVTKQSSHPVHSAFTQAWARRPRGGETTILQPLQNMDSSSFVLGRDLPQ